MSNFQNVPFAQFFNVQVTYDTTSFEWGGSTWTRTRTNHEGLHRGWFHEEYGTVFSFSNGAEQLLFVQWWEAKASFHDDDVMAETCFLEYIF